MDRRLATTSRTAKIMFLATKTPKTTVDKELESNQMHAEIAQPMVFNIEEHISNETWLTGNIVNCCENSQEEDKPMVPSNVDEQISSNEPQLNDNIVTCHKNAQEEDIFSNTTTDDGDFGSLSSDEYICGTEESSSEDSIPVNMRKVPQRRKITIEESEMSLSTPEDDPVNSAGCSFWTENGMNVEGKKRKIRKSKKERREDRIKRNILRNKGLEYTTNKGKIVKPREMRDLENCRQKCKDRISNDLRKKLFEEYWNLGSYNNRVSYMEKCVEVHKKKTSVSSPKKRRTVSIHYYVYINGFHKTPICKNCLLRTYNESNRYLQTICEKIRTYGHIPPPQRRSKANNIPNAKLEEIKAHLASFPSAESHYGRSKTSKKFLNSELTLQKIYDLYKEKTENPVSKTIFTKVFKCMNLSFKKPSLDTCSKCDSLSMKLKYAAGEDAVVLQKELESHQKAYRAAYEEKRKDKIYAESSNDTVVITFDLQQCLPTPFLKTNVAFYKRQLWTFNLTIHDLKSNKAYCYMWPECTGGRGANDISSCLFDFIVNQLPMLYPNAKHLIMYSDSCPGQNKNSIITTMLLLVIKSSAQLATIEHKFLIPGHTHMEADTDHALIERKKKRTNMDIHLPRDWYQLVRTASNKTAKLNVIEMSRDKFYDFADFCKQYFTTKKLNEDKEKFIWAQIRCIKYVKNNFPHFYYKENFDNDTEYKCVDYSKRQKFYDLVSIDTVKKAYSCEIPISTEKKKDLLQLLPFIHQSAHEFYRNLSCKSDIQDTVPFNEQEYEE